MKHAPKNVQLIMCLKDPNGVELSEWVQDFEVNSMYDPHYERWICFLNGHIQFTVPEEVLLLTLDHGFDDEEGLEDE